MTKERFEMVATAAFGLEAVVAKELKALGMARVTTENGRVCFETDAAGVCRVNLWLRSGDRVYVRLHAFEAGTFTELFDGIRGLDWADWMAEDARAVVNAKSVESALFSLSDIQSISKKAIVEAMKATYGMEWLAETGATYGVHVHFNKDVAEVLLDTSGIGLHKRGYRAHGNEAPIKETLAAALVQLSGWQGDQPLWDPFCGSGTLLIEAAMIGRRIAPGLSRSFAGEGWKKLPEALWKRERQAAYACIDTRRQLRLFGSDVDAQALEIAGVNSDLAGVAEDIRFFQLDVLKLSREALKAGMSATDAEAVFDRSGMFLTNPPYGERLSEAKAVSRLSRALRKGMGDFPGWGLHVITAHDGFEKDFGLPSTRNRKLYNGRIRCYFYSYEGESWKNQGAR